METFVPLDPGVCVSKEVFPFPLETGRRSRKGVLWHGDPHETIADSTRRKRQISIAEYKFNLRKSDTDGDMV